MKKLLFVTILVALACGRNLYGQSFDWNIRGGLNMMRSYTSGQKVALLYHAGAQAGVRITNFGFYGEAVYSLNENQYADHDPVGYLIPSLVVKGFWRKHLFVEFGGSFLSKVGDSGVDPDEMNPDNKLFFMAGLGTQFSKLQISMRSTAQSSTSYVILQLTAAVKF
jgi:hypothetical protein